MKIRVVLTMPMTIKAHTINKSYFLGLINDTEYVSARNIGVITCIKTYPDGHLSDSAIVSLSSINVPCCGGTAMGHCEVNLS